MKIRNSFVSNSSSASFVVALNKLTSPELIAILEWCNKEQLWSVDINEESGLLEGFTAMDNGELSTFLEEIGINKIRINGD